MNVGFCRKHEKRSPYELKEWLFPLSMQDKTEPLLKFDAETGLLMQSAKAKIRKEKAKINEAKVPTALTCLQILVLFALYIFSW